VQARSAGDHSSVAAVALHLARLISRPDCEPLHSSYATCRPPSSVFLYGGCCGAASLPAAVVWCPVAKGQQLLVKLPAPEHLVKEAPSSSDPGRPTGAGSFSRTCLVRGGMSGWTPPRGLSGPSLCLIIWLRALLGGCCCWACVLATLASPWCMAISQGCGRARMARVVWRP
jgi:hypothetical protein